MKETYLKEEEFHGKSDERDFEDFYKAYYSFQEKGMDWAKKYIDRFEGTTYQKKQYGITLADKTWFLIQEAKKQNRTVSDLVDDMKDEGYTLSTNLRRSIRRMDKAGIDYGMKWKDFRELYNQEYK